MTAADPRYLLASLALLLVPASGLCLVYAVRADANARGANGTGWGLFVLVLAPIAAPAYLLYRHRLSDRTEPPNRTERWLGSFGIGVTAAVVVSTAISPPDPFSLILFALPLIAVSVPLAAVACYDVDPRAFAT